jgi:hypothetical protein
VDRCALFVDAGYLLADGAMAVHGTRHRETVSWDFGGLLQLMGNLARERTGMPLLRCYWYESTVEGRRAPEHEALADLPGLKLRLGKIRPGRREGVDTEIQRDLLALARNGAIADAIVVSGDEDLASVITDAQDLGMRVTVVHVAVDGNWTISRVLRQECDDLIEIGSGHLRPYVTLLAGMNGMNGLSNGMANGMTNGIGAGSPLSNGNGSTLSALSQLHNSGPMPTAPPSSPITSPVPQPQPQLSAPTPSLGSGQQTYSQHPLLANSGPMPVTSSTTTGGMPVTDPTTTGGIPITGMTTTGAQPIVPQASPSPSSYLTPSTPNSYSNAGTTQNPYSNATQNSYASPPTAPPSSSYPSSYGSPAESANPYNSVPQQMAPAPIQQSTPTLSDAVKAAHQEGQDFGESVARDAPALWLEAVLARKPRMPSDLEARLLQGSALPIDFLLHDEVRHALRRGFWDALERSRR